MIQNLRIISWNVRGINNQIAIRNIRKLVRETKATILLLQETKCQNWSDRSLEAIWDSTNHGWLVVNSEGAAGGLLISWDKQIVTLFIVQSSHSWLWCKGSTSSGVDFSLINVYGPLDTEEKLRFWSELYSIHGKTDDQPS